ncbi:MAG: bifunctional alpha/beta hydrolase/OsmC family protein [Thermoanaerobaculia bacterium]|nr:bifunctional alpha/beta hydrolase/OsmC family protein [Thermoanaerobaculia bacterium]
MKSQRVSFPGSLGHELAARLDTATDRPAAWALFAHCFTCSKDLKAVGRLSKALVGRGFGVLRFDFTGLGESGGDFGATSFTSNLEDLRIAVDWLRREHAAPSLLVGHSLGGAAILSMAGEVEECRAVATLGAPSTTRHILETLRAQVPEIEGDGTQAVQVTLAGRSFQIQKQMLDDLESHRVVDAVRRLGKPLLVCHSPRDETVGIDHAKEIFLAAKHPKSFFSLGEADHLLMKDPADARWVADMLASWASRYLDAEPLDPSKAEPDSPFDQPLEAGEVQVVGRAGFVQDVTTADGHRLRADEPTSLGGTDTGPNPYDFLLTALGTCTNMTLRMYADRKGWPLEGVASRLSHRRVHARDCEDCESEDGMVAEIRRVLAIEGDALDDDQRQRLMEIADRCPVHRTLTSEIKIRTEPG